MIKITKKKLILIILLGVIIFSCNTTSTIDYAIISGEINNPKIDKIMLANDKDTFVINVVDKHFSDTLSILQGYHNLVYGEQKKTVYLKPGFDIQIQLGDTLNFEGKGAAENNYLVAKAALSKEHRHYLDYKSCAQLNETDFLSLMDSVEAIQLKLINEVENQFDSEFNFIEQNKLKYAFLSKKAGYESSRKYGAGERDYKVSSAYYPNLFKELDVNDNRLIGNNDYLRVINSYIWNITYAKLENNDTTDVYVTFLEVLNSEVSDSTVKEKISYKIGNTRLDITKELDKVYKLVVQNLSNAAYLEKIESKYQGLKKVEKGAVSPSFKFNDINGKEVALEDLSGKIVYIDIWSTSCAPCMTEIPYQKALEDSFEGKNICFVAINVGDKMEHWKKTVKSKKLGGIQLYAPDSKVSFFKDYMVSGIPRYILIDTDGTIISSSANRPSNPKLKEELDELI